MPSSPIPSLRFPLPRTRTLRQLSSDCLFCLFVCQDQPELPLRKKLKTKPDESVAKEDVAAIAAES